MSLLNRIAQSNGNPQRTIAALRLINEYLKRELRKGVVHSNKTEEGSTERQDTTGLPSRSSKSNLIEITPTRVPERVNRPRSVIGVYRVREITSLTPSDPERQQVVSLSVSGALLA